MYHILASYYDLLTGEIDYPARGAYFNRLLRRYLPAGDEEPILMDLGCGTGSLSGVMSGLGYDVIGVDQSPEMLSAAMSKGNGRVQYICQSFTQLDLFGTVDAAICALDCLNHLASETDLRETFRRVSLFMVKGGVFLFDVNTPYKHREVLGNETFVYDLKQIYCVWQNATDFKTLRTDITLDFFVPEKGRYYRESEEFSEQCWSGELLEQLLRETGFEVLAVYAADTEQPLGERDQRAVYLARKLTSTGTVNG